VTSQRTSVFDFALPRRYRRRHRAYGALTAMAQLTVITSRKLPATTLKRVCSFVLPRSAVRRH